MALAKRTSGRFPYFTSGAFDGIYGKTLSMLWREFEASETVAARAATAADAAVGSRLTHLGFTVSTPRVDGDGTTWFSASNPHGFPALYRLRAGRLERVVDRYGGSGLTVGHDVVLFDQAEFVRGAGLSSDLYAFDRGRVVRD
jgi:hypothetical protein